MTSKSNHSNRDGLSRLKRTQIRYPQTYPISEESFCSTNSDSDYNPKKTTDYESDSDTTYDEPRDRSVSSKMNHTRKNPLLSTKKTPCTQENSSSSQESMKTRLTQPVKRRILPKQGPKKKNKTIMIETIEASRQSSQRLFQTRDEDEGSDSSLFFTDEISEASSTMREHPESLSKNTLLKKHLDLSQRNVKAKPVKRKDLSASRKAFKKVKLNDTDEVEYIPDEIECITLDSDNFSELENSNRTEDAVNHVRVKTEKKSPSVKIEKEEDSPKKSKRSKKNVIKEEAQPFKFNDEIKSEPTLNVADFEIEDPFIFGADSQIKSEAVDVPKVKKEKVEEKSKPSKSKLKEKTTSKTDVDEKINIKTENENSKPASKSKSKEKSANKTSDEKINIKTENKIKTEVPSTSKSESVEKSKKIQFQGKSSTGIQWQTEMLADLMELDLNLAKNIIVLFENDCTIPFIARYRRENTNNMDSDQLRQVKCAYEYIKTLEKKSINVLKKLESAGKLTKSLENSIYHVKSIEELDYIYAPYKQSSAKSKAEKARNLGLEEAAFMVLNGTDEFNPAIFVNPQEDGIKDAKEVIQSVQHILAEIFSKDEAVLEFIHKIENQIPITVKSTKKKSDTVEDDGEKFRIYYEFSKYVRDLQSHQILALNRGENLKILTVKMIVSESFYDRLYKFCFNKWLRSGQSYPLRKKMFEDSFKDSYTRLISPLLTRRTKAKLSRKAQVNAIENFALNLKSLLQTPPVKGCPILGIDPGLRHGVKFALISNQGDVLWTSVLNFDLKDSTSFKNQKNMNIIKTNMVQHQCELMAIGNGCGSREIETVISDYLKNNFFNPELNVSYTFVNERGASVYSCSSIAKEEFPDLDPNLISAVFIARSLQDPLSEFVKVEPKHLGVGMYQHDMPEVKLNQSLDEVVMECVSFTGIDLNTASIYLLKRVSGLGDTRAANIIKWRQENGPFKNRQQLLKVNKIGPKTFEQCSGFLRIHSQTCNVQIKDIKKKGIPKDSDYNPLDSTWIHPESYNDAYLFIGHCESNVSDLGTPSFIEKIKRVVQSKGLKTIADVLNQSEQTISFVYDALIKPNNYDYRYEFSKPIFIKGLRSLDSLKVGDILQGVVSNVVAFGAFVDIGVGKSGLIHVSNMNRMRVQIGDRVEVRIMSIEKNNGRIGLFLVQKN